jgi:hypothetical protein
MPYFRTNNEAEAFPDLLQAYVDKDPESGAQQLSEVPFQLTEMIDYGDQAIAEKAVQILATAVGKQSM